MAIISKFHRTFLVSMTFVAIILIGTFSPMGHTANAASNSVSFSDLKSGQEGYQEVTSLVNQNIINGYSDGRFAPYESLSRKHVAVMLANALQLPKPADISTILSAYSDIDANNTYAWQIAAVTKAGIFKGNNGSFNPEKTITREQIATVLVNAFHLKETTANVSFSDYDKISPSHQKNVTILAENGITIGKPDGYGQRLYDGHGSVLRVQFAIFLDKTMKVIKAAPTANLSLALDMTGNLPSGATPSEDSQLLINTNNENVYTLVKGYSNSQVNVLTFDPNASLSSDAKPGVYPIKLIAISGSTDLKNKNGAIKQFNDTTGSAKDYLNGAADGVNPYGLIKVDSNGQMSLIDGYQYSVDQNTTIGMMIPNTFPAGQYTFEVDIPNIYGQVLKKQMVLAVNEYGHFDMALDHTGAVPTGLTEASDSTFVKSQDATAYVLTRGSNSNEVNAITLADTTKISQNIKPGNYEVKLVGINGLGNLSQENSNLLAYNATTGAAKTYLDGAANGENAYGILKIDNQYNVSLVDGYQYSLDPNTTSGMMIPNNFPTGTYIYRVMFTDKYNTQLGSYFVIQVK